MAANDTLNTLADPERASELFASPYSPRRHAERLAASFGAERVVPQLLARRAPGFPVAPRDVDFALAARDAVALALLTGDLASGASSDVREQAGALAGFVCRFAGDAAALAYVSFLGELSEDVWDRDAFARREGFVPGAGCEPELIERAAAVLGEMSDALRELFADADPDAPTHPADAERGTFCENRSFDLWIDAADGDSVNVSAGLRGCIWDMYTCLASFLGWTLARLG